MGGESVGRAGGAGGGRRGQESEVSQARAAPRPTSGRTLTRTLQLLICVTAFFFNKPLLTRCSCCSTPLQSLTSGVGNSRSLKSGNGKDFLLIIGSCASCTPSCCKGGRHVSEKLNPLSNETLSCLLVISTLLSFLLDFFLLVFVV